MKLTFLFLLFAPSLFAQTDCTDFLSLLGERDVSQKVQSLLKDCGPFEESITIGGDSKTFISEEKGIQIMFINREVKKTSLPKYEVLSIELSSFTNKGGYKDELPFGFTLGMDHKLVKAHIEELKDVQYNKKDLSKKSSSFTYTGALNPKLYNRQVKVYVSQFDGKTISSMRLRLK